MSSNKEITVGDLRDLLASYADDLPVMIGLQGIGWDPLACVKMDVTALDGHASMNEQAWEAVLQEEGFCDHSSAAPECLPIPHPVLALYPS